jgi:hypothetical protein
MHKRTLLLSSIAVSAVLGVFGVIPMASASAPAPARSSPGVSVARSATGTPTVSKSSYWAGYVATQPNYGADYFSYVTATFTVPALSCDETYEAAVSHFAGLSGYWEPNTGNPLQAAGIFETCNTPTGAPSYHGVYWNVYNDGGSGNAT